MYGLNVFWDQINKQTIILRNPDKLYFSFAKYDFSWHQGKMNIPVKSYSVFPLVCLYVCTIPVLCNDWLGLFISIFKNCIPFIHHFLEFPIKIFHKSIAATSRSSIDTCICVSDRSLLHINYNFLQPMHQLSALQPDHILM